MIKFMVMIIIGIIILKNLSNIIAIVAQLIVTWIGFMIHPLLGLFLLLAYISDWLGFTKEKDYNKNRKRTNSYFDDRPKNEQKKEENKRQQKKTQQERPRPNQQQKTSGFFTGCTTREQLKKRHRELCKKYHPDKGGDIEVFKKMQAEYERLIIKFK